MSVSHPHSFLLQKESMPFALGSSVGSTTVLGLPAVFTNTSRISIPFQDSFEVVFFCCYVHIPSDSSYSLNAAGDHTLLPVLRMVGEEK